MQKKFKVNLGGIITLLSEHLYSTPGVFVRELLQNGIDAIRAAQKKLPDLTGEIRLSLDTAETVLTIRDNGIGLSRADIEAFLSVIGQSSKYIRNAEGALVKDDDFIGQFGIGLLSCFIVSDHISVTTKKRGENHRCSWTGNSDGTYEITSLDVDTDAPFGTTIELRAKESHKDFFREEYLLNNLRFYGMFLPCEMIFEREDRQIALNESFDLSDDGDAAKIGRLLFERDFLDHIHIEDDHVHGVIYLLAREMSVTAAKRGRIYAKGILVTEDPSELMPDWAVFMMPLISCDNLRLTASREDIISDQNLEEAKSLIEERIKGYFHYIAKFKPALFDKLLHTHMRAIKQLACEDETLFTMFIDHIEFSTTLGDMTLRKICRNNQSILFTSSMDEYNQIKTLTRAQGICVINAAYVYNEELVHRFIKTEKNVMVVEVSPDIFHSALQPAENTQRAEQFLDEVTRALWDSECDASVKRFQPAELPVIYTISDQARLYNDLKQLSAGSDLFADISGSVLAGMESTSAKLCFNEDNDLVQKLMTYTNPQAVENAVRLLYVQAKINGAQVATPMDYRMMNACLSFLLDHLGRGGAPDA